MLHHTDHLNLHVSASLPASLRPEQSTPMHPGARHGPWLKVKAAESFKMLETCANATCHYIPEYKHRLHYKINHQRVITFADIEVPNRLDCCTHVATTSGRLGSTFRSRTSSLSSSRSSIMRRRLAEDMMPYVSGGSWGQGERWRETGEG